MKFIGPRTLAYFVSIFIMFIGFNAYFNPTYTPTVSKNNFDEKLKGTYLLDNSPNNNVIYIGSSELNTKTIQSHPSNFFSDQNDFQVNIAGRGSCQAIVFSSVLASIDNLEDKKVVITLAPQSFVEGGIAPDMYFANFSPLQYLKIQSDDTLSDDIKKKFLNRFTQLDKQYLDSGNDRTLFYKQRLITKAYLAKTPIDKAKLVFLKPFIAIEENFLTLSDKSHSYVKINDLELYGQDRPKDIDFEQEKVNMLEFAKEDTTNNDFGIMNDYYNVNIGRKYEMLENKDENLSYTSSVEYEDVQLMLDICKEKNIEPLILMHPLHGQWSDYTGFTEDKRLEYYDKLENLLIKNDANYVNLKDHEYEKYYLCDVLHYGWLGWLDVDQRIYNLYYENGK